MIWSAQEISKKFRNALGKNISPRTINVFAEKLGYHMKRIGGKRGYDQSLYTALTRHLKELLDYDSQQAAKTPQKPQKQPKEIVWDDDNYEVYNGERDNIDYEWEKKVGEPLPKFYVHSANPKHGLEINRILTSENKQIIRLTDSDLFRIIKESVYIILKENYGFIH